MSVAPLAAVLHLLLAFPSGVLADRLSRGLAAAAYLAAIGLEAPTYLLAPAGPPYDVLQVAVRADLAEAGNRAQDIFGMAVILAVAAVLALRLRAADRFQRRTLGLLGGVGILAILFVTLSANLLEPVLNLDQLFVAQIVPLVVIPVAFLLGLLRGGYARMGGIEELSARLGAGEEGAAGLREGLVGARGDPSIELPVVGLRARGLRRLRGRRGAAAVRAGRAGVSEVELDGRVVGMIAYDAGLLATRPSCRRPGGCWRSRSTASGWRPSCAPVARPCATHALALWRRATASAGGWSATCTTGPAAADGLALILRVAGARVDGDAEMRGLLGEAERELADALSELRELARGLHPAILSDVSLAGALESLAERSALPVDLGRCPGGRLPDEVEVAAYYVVAEPMANAAKHPGASLVRVGAERRNGLLLVEVSDDGCGGAAATPGSGLEGLRDRVDAVGGRLVIESRPRAGTRLMAELRCG